MYEPTNQDLAHFNYIVCVKSSNDYSKGFTLKDCNKFMKQYSLKDDDVIIYKSIAFWDILE